MLHGASKAKASRRAPKINEEHRKVHPALMRIFTHRVARGAESKSCGFFHVLRSFLRKVRRFAHNGCDPSRASTLNGQCWSRSCFRAQRANQNPVRPPAPPCLQGRSLLRRNMFDLSVFPFSTRRPRRGIHSAPSSASSSRRAPRFQQPLGNSAYETKITPFFKSS